MPSERADYSIPTQWKRVLLICATFWAISCHQPQRRTPPIIEFTKLPRAGEGNPYKLATIEGRVKGARPGQRIILFARSGAWWVQPYVGQPFTTIRPDFRWKNSTHPGNAYAALLVSGSYRPPSTLASLPEKGGDVLAVASADELESDLSERTIWFRGFQWEARQTPNNPGGTLNIYDPANLSVDDAGALHLRIAKSGSNWTSAQASLSESLGYGTYRFVIRDVSQLEPAAILSLSIYDNATNARQADIEIGRWGEPTSKNAQFVVQPYYIPENSVRFVTPPGKITYMIHWQPDRLTFQASTTGNSDVADHVFTSDIPVAGNDSVHMNLYVFGNQRYPLRKETEVVVENFEFLP